MCKILLISKSKLNKEIWAWFIIVTYERQEYKLKTVILYYVVYKTTPEWGDKLLIILNTQNDHWIYLKEPTEFSSSKKSAVAQAFVC